MYIFLRQFLRRFLALFGLGLVTRDRLVALEQARIQRDNILAKLPFILEVDTGDKWGAEARFEILKESKSESGQDLFAILTSNFKEGGFFSNLVHIMVLISATLFCWKKFLVGRDSW